MTIAVQNRWNSAHSPSYSHSAFVKVVWRCFLSALWGVWGVWTVKRVESFAVTVIFMVFLKKKKKKRHVATSCVLFFTWIWFYMNQLETFFDIFFFAWDRERECPVENTWDSGEEGAGLPILTYSDVKAQCKRIRSKQYWILRQRKKKKSN